MRALRVGILRAEALRPGILRPGILRLGFLLFAALLALPAAPVDAPAQSGAGAAAKLVDGPFIRFDRRSWDFGELPQHTRVTQTFRIANEGTETLRLLKVEPDCGCTLIELDDRELEPGESVDLKVMFDSRDFEGEQRKVIIIETNDPGEPRIDLLLTANVKAELDCVPRVVDFGKVRRGEQPVRSVSLRALEGVPFETRLPEKGTERVLWTVERDASLGPNAYRLDARLRADAPFGRFNEWIDIPVSHPKYRHMRISIRGLVHGHFVPSEVGINFGTPAVGETVDRSIRVTGSTAAPYRITHAETTAPWLKASLRPDGNGYVLTVRLQADRSRQFEEKAILHSTDPEQPRIEVDLKGKILGESVKAGRAPRASGGSE